MKTLLEEAMEIKLNIRKDSFNYDEQDMELVKAWLEGKIRYGQITKIKGIRGSNVYNYLAGGIKELYRCGKLIIK